LSQSNAQWLWSTTVLYRTRGNDGDGFVQSSRNAMLLFAFFAGAAIAIWSWRLGGGVAAVVATLFYSFDPNFLGHMPLVTNDVAAALVFAASSFLIWICGRRLTFPRVLALAFCIGAAVCIKFSALLLIPVLLLLLAIRVALRWDWEWRQRSIKTVIGRSTQAVLVAAAVAFVSFAVIWASYSFRFLPAPGVGFDRTETMRNLVRQQRLAALSEPAIPHGIAVNFALAAEDRGLLPQAFTKGIVDVYANSLYRDSFLLGRISGTGFWYYFPVAVAVKTPLATMFAALIAAFVLIRQRAATVLRPATMWTGACLILPPLMYFIVAMNANVNLGLRHVFPVYPFLFIIIGVAAGRLIAHRNGRLLLSGLIAIFLAESLSAYPNFISFFNAAAGGPGGGIRILADSNLDWGQDLKLVRDWQQKNPDIPLYLSYYGMADPSFYGIRYVNFPGGYVYGPPPRPLPVPAILAVSATNLQGEYYPRWLRDFYQPLVHREPDDKISDTIYLYRIGAGRAMPDANRYNVPR
jgi:hypothetical protein